MPHVVVDLQYKEISDLLSKLTFRIILYYFRYVMNIQGVHLISNLHMAD
jgi:hypothetical protein